MMTEIAALRDFNLAHVGCGSTSTGRPKPVVLVFPQHSETRRQFTALAANAIRQETSVSADERSQLRQGRYSPL
jgi:hypothetical protein